MYRYRRSTPAERRELIRARVERGFPVHSPPHISGPDRCFMITSACFEHRPIMNTDERRHLFLEELARACNATETGLEAWVVLPNHYHVLIDTPDLRMFGRLIQQVHGRTSRQWNVEDNASGRKCGTGFRIVRSAQRHTTSLR